MNSALVQCSTLECILCEQTKYTLLEHMQCATLTQLNITKLPV